MSCCISLSISIKYSRCCLMMSAQCSCTQCSRSSQQLDQHADSIPGFE
jgi:hypothetical protein